MKRYIEIIILITLTLSTITRVNSQSIFTLDDCLQKAVQNHPLSRQYGYISSSTDLVIKNLNQNYLPELDILGQVSYQSDVTAVPVTVPLPAFEIEPVDKDWYKVYLDARQIIYDGGAIKNGKELESYNGKVSSQSLDVELYKLKNQVVSTYFTILVMQEGKNLLELKKSSVESSLKEVTVAVNNGVILASNRDILKAEILKIEQQLKETETAIEFGKRTLSELISEPLPQDAVLQLPVTEDEVLLLTENKRPEYGLFSLQKERLDVMQDATRVKNMPSLFAWGQAGGGRPALDMLNNDFTGYYIVGMTIKWKPYDWNKAKNQREILGLNQDIIETQKETFDKNVRIAMNQNLLEIAKYKELIERDEEIIALRQNISKSSESQLNNGIITSTQYITELNSETEARMQLQLHRIKLVQAHIDYKSTFGEL